LIALVPDAVASTMVNPDVWKGSQVPPRCAVRPPDAVTQLGPQGLWYKFTEVVVEVTLKLHDGLVPG
jgi:hypothetical protein